MVMCCAFKFHDIKLEYVSQTEIGIGQPLKSQPRKQVNVIRSSDNAEVENYQTLCGPRLILSNGKKQDSSRRLVFHEVARNIIAQSPRGPPSDNCIP